VLPLALKLLERVAGAAEVVALGAETVVVVSSLWDLIKGPAKAKRSGGSGAAKKKAGAELIRGGNKLSKGALKDAYKKQGNRLINQGNADSHPGNR
jgi:hypothetical protein